MERAQTSQNTAPNPTPKLPLHNRPGGMDPDLGAGERRRHLILDPTRQTLDQTPAPRHHHIIQQHGPDIRVHTIQALLDQINNTILLARGRVLPIRQRHLGIEHALHAAVPVRCLKHLVPPIRHLERFPRVRLRRVQVRHPVGRVARQLTGARPRGDDGFLEFRQHAVFLQRAKGRMRFGSRGEVFERGLGLGTRVDGGFGGDEVVWGQGHGGLGGGE